MTAPAPPAPAVLTPEQTSDLGMVTGYSSSITALQSKVTNLANKRGDLLLGLHEGGVHVDALATALGGVTRATAYKLIRQAKTRREPVDTTAGMPVTSGS